MSRHVPALRSVSLTYRIALRQLVTRGRLFALVMVGVAVTAVSYAVGVAEDAQPDNAGGASRSSGGEGHPAVHPEALPYNAGSLSVASPCLLASDAARLRVLRMRLICDSSLRGRSCRLGRPCRA